MASIGDRIRAARESLGLTQFQASERMTKGTTVLREWERGKREIGEGDMIMVSEALGIHLQWLKTGEGDMRTPRAHDTNTSGEIPYGKKYYTEIGNKADTESGESGTKLLGDSANNELATRLSNLLHSRLNMSDEDLLMFLEQEGGAYNLSLLTVLEKVEGETIEVEYFAQIRRRKKKVSPPQNKPAPPSEDDRA